MKSLIFNTTLLCLFGVFLFYTKSKNNVCKSFDDYYSNRDSNKNCYYNPDYSLTTPEIVERHGYRVENHGVVTKDGYALTLFRIPPQKGVTAKPIFLQHGYSANSEIFVKTGKKSLAFILANHGYDVWLGNSRGTRYSRNHTNFNISDEAYWNFSFDELGIYDLPASINYVRNLTERKVTYIGFSLGTVIMYVYGITYPEKAYNEVDMFVNFAPSVFLKEYSLGLHFLISNWEFIKPIMKTLVKTDSIWHTILSPLIGFTCFPFPFQMRMCMLPLMLTFGFNYGQHDPETLPMILKSTIENPSLKTFTHGVQVAQLGPSRFDYGTKTNLRIYGSEEPPAYNFSKMKVPVYIFSAKNDKVATKRNIEALYKSLPREITTHGVYEVNDENFSHTDFVFGKNVVELVYNHLVNFLQRLP